MTYDTAVFNGASANTVIDLDGRYVIRNVTVTGASTPTYTFGTSRAQTLRLISEAQCKSYSNGGVFKIEASVVNMPVIAAVLSMRCSGTINEGIHITNSSTLPMEIGDIGRHVDANPLGVYPENIGSPSWATTYTSGPAYVLLDGTGPFTLKGACVEMPSNRTGAFMLNSGGGYSIGEGVAVTNARVLQVYTMTTMTIPETSKFVLDPGGDITIVSGSGFTTEGAGEFVLWGGGAGWTSVYAYPTSPWISNGRLTVTNSANGTAGEFRYCGTGGMIEFGGVTSFTGDYAIGSTSYPGPIYSASALGLAGEDGPMGALRMIKLTNGGKFVYTGPGETSSKPFSVVAGRADKGGNTMCLEQEGTGHWIVASSVTQECAEATLNLRNDKPLVAGNVVTVEPGIYLPGQFGMRLEDCGVITESGYEVFSQLGHEMVVI